MDPLPPIRFAKSDDLNIAFTQFGRTGTDDVVLVAGATTTMEYFWGSDVVRSVGEHALVTWYDKRGLGRSDGVANFTFEERIDDIRAVMDTAGIESAHLGGVSEGGPMCILFSATYPERVKSLSLYGTYPSTRKRPGYPFGWDMTLSEYSRFVDRIVDARLGDPDAVRWVWEMMAPSLASDPGVLEQFSSSVSGSPAAARLIWEVMYEVDVRHVLPSVQTPTTIVHKTGDRLCPVEGGRYLAEHIEGAKLVEVPGDDHASLKLPDWATAIIDNVRRTPGSAPAMTDRRLATVMFTDIVGSTSAAEGAGDHAWSQLLDRHDSTVSSIVTEYRGDVIKTTGDGVLADFDGPSRAVSCACALHDAMTGLGMPIRAGLHTGEIEVRGDDIAGLAVHIASRVSNLAEANETVVSSTVKDLVVGAGFEFDDRGEHQLKGIESAWHCYSLMRDHNAAETVS